MAAKLDSSSSANGGGISNGDHNGGGGDGGGTHGLTANGIVRSSPLLATPTTVAPVAQQQQLIPDQPDGDAIKMFVGQVPRSMDESELRGMFEDFGPVYQINVLRDKLTGQSKGRNG